MSSSAFSEDGWFLPTDASTEDEREEEERREVNKAKQQMAGQYHSTVWFF